VVDVAKVATGFTGADSSCLQFGLDGSAATVTLTRDACVFGVHNGPVADGGVHP
jgi:hypothetical protein